MSSSRKDREDKEISNSQGRQPSETMIVAVTEKPLLEDKEEYPICIALGKIILDLMPKISENPNGINPTVGMVCINISKEQANTTLESKASNNTTQTKELLISISGEAGCDQNKLKDINEFLSSDVNAPIWNTTFNNITLLSENDMEEAKEKFDYGTPRISIESYPIQLVESSNELPLRTYGIKSTHDNYLYYKHNIMKPAKLRITAGERDTCLSYYSG